MLAGKCGAGSSKAHVGGAGSEIAGGTIIDSTAFEISDSCGPAARVASARSDAMRASERGSTKRWFFQFFRNVAGCVTGWMSNAR